MTTTREKLYFPYPKQDGAIGTANSRQPKCHMERKKKAMCITKLKGMVMIEWKVGKINFVWYPKSYENSIVTVPKP
jgi:hypothetical protein